MELEQYLSKLGLDQKEIRTYLVCLELGENSIVEIRNLLGFPRTTVYQILERLRDHQLITIIETKTRRLYTPNRPETILTLLKNKRNKVDEQIESFNEALPELRQRYSKSSSQPKVRFFPPSELHQIYEEILEVSLDEVWFVSEFGKLQTVLGERYLKDWVYRRVRNNILSRVILVKGEDIKNALYAENKDYLRKVKYAPDGFESPTHVIIYGDSVATITTTGENFGTVITSREYANTMRDWYKILWRNSITRPKIEIS